MTLKFSNVRGAMRYNGGTMFDNPPPPFNCNPLLVAVMRHCALMLEARCMERARLTRDENAAQDQASGRTPEEEVREQG
jgi:hypothetical protein